MPIRQALKTWYHSPKKFRIYCLPLVNKITYCKAVMNCLAWHSSSSQSGLILKFSNLQFFIYEMKKICKFPDNIVKN